MSEPNLKKQQTILLTIALIGISATIFTGTLSPLMIALLPLYYGLKIARKRYKANLKIKLKSTGVLIFANFKNIELNKQFSINEDHPYSIICEWIHPELGTTYTFKSYFIWDNPKKYFTDITHIPVYVEADNYQKYYMDLSEIIPNYMP